MSSQSHATDLVVYAKSYPLVLISQKTTASDLFIAVAVMSSMLPPILLCARACPGLFIAEGETEGWKAESCGGVPGSGDGATTPSPPATGSG